MLYYAGMTTRLLVEDDSRIRSALCPALADGGHRVIDSRVLDVHIRRLRREVEKAAGR